MTKLTYIVKGKEVGTIAEAYALATNRNEIVTRYTPEAKPPMTEKEKGRRDLRLKAFGFKK